MHKTRKFTGTQRIMLGFLIIIIAGALLLMLPFATRSGEHTTLSGAMLSSVSATCVTGLVAYDTWSHWTLFGQLVLLTEIQIGGLGFITISTFAMIMMRKRISIRRRTEIQNSLSTLQIKGSVRLVRRIMKGTIAIEGIGALLLAIRFIPQYGIWKGLYFGVFHSISAFCNGGFDLMGTNEPFSSLTGYSGDPLVILTVSVLVIIGGIGFLVWEDILEHHLQWKKYRFHTKIVLSATFVLLAGSTILFLILERNNLFTGMSAGHRFLAAFFSAVTPRTAGFNSVDTAGLSNGGLFLTILLMFIGGSPGSTAGGIKTVTLVVLLLYIKAYVCRDKDCVIFKRRVDDDAVRRASIVIFYNLLMAILGIMIIFTVQGNLDLREVLFEVFSAIGTAGMSTGVTRQLHLVPKIVIMILMYFGRMGSLTFAMSFTEHRHAKKIRYPEEQIIVG